MKPKRPSLTQLAIICLSVVTLLSSRSMGVMKDNSEQLANEIEHELRQEIGLYFPRCVAADAQGWNANFLNDWTPGPPDDRMIVFQSRMTWVAAEVARRRPDLAAELGPDADGGVAYLRSSMWDSKEGGFFWNAQDPGLEKRAYGISFAIYAAAADYRRSHNLVSLKLAQDGFHWLDDHGHDSVNGGYFETFDRAGNPLRSATTSPVRDMLGTLAGQKSMNTHIHLLEAFTELFGVWPDPALKERLVELRDIVRSRIASPTGYLRMFFQADWQPTSDRDSFGHDVETSFLLIEADKALNGFAAPATIDLARKMVDHALKVGWDDRMGGLFDEGDPGHADKLVKTWWVQAEMLNALSQLHEMFDSSGEQYLQPFLKQWAFIREHQIDSVHGGWFEELDRDGRPNLQKMKSHDWKACYHTCRALLNTADRLKHQTP